MNNGWTGGQYSVFRALLGLYLAAHFAMLLPFGRELFSHEGLLPEAATSPLAHLFPSVLALSDSPAMVSSSLVIATLASLLFAIGWKDRWLALLVWYLLASLFVRNPLIANPSLPYIGWMLIAHACLPTGPFGSFDARSRVDPDNGWKFPRGIFLAGWVALSLGYTYSGCAKLTSPSWVDGTALERVLDNPLVRPTFVREALLGLPPSMLRLATWTALALEISFAPLLLIRRARPWLWSAMLAMHLALIVLIDFADLSLGMVLMHLFTFDPLWIRAYPARGGERIFFDGTCGLCHRWIRFVMAEDARGERFRFAPLASETFERAVPLEERAGLPDSVIVLTDDARLLSRSAAVLHIFDRLGGGWRAIAWLARTVPRPLRDLAYDAIARVRKIIFPPPPAACPLAPSHQRSRFDP